MGMAKIPGMDRGMDRVWVWVRDPSLMILAAATCTHKFHDMEVGTGEREYGVGRWHRRGRGGVAGFCCFGSGRTGNPHTRI